jgi:hypothetical protein
VRGVINQKVRGEGKNGIVIAGYKRSAAAHSRNIHARFPPAELGVQLSAVCFASSSLSLPLSLHQSKKNEFIFGF